MTRPSILRATLVTLVLAGAACSREAAPSRTIDHLVVEASCGSCQFDLPGKGCDLAVRIDGHAYYVDGTKMDEHGDPHAADGFCNAVRKARVSGKLEGERFAATSFELLPVGAQ